MTSTHEVGVAILCTLVVIIWASSISWALVYKDNFELTAVISFLPPLILGLWLL